VKDSQVRTRLAYQFGNIPMFVTEEFGIYLNYVRKLGFEETPDYEFLRELFAKVMKNNNDVDDGVFDWNSLNSMCCFRCPESFSKLLPLQTERDGKLQWFVASISTVILELNIAFFRVKIKC